MSFFTGKNKKKLSHFLQADKRLDFAVMMKKMILAKTLKNTWLVLFVEIIVSDRQRNV